ncbi:MAG: dihydrodipicolinate synthase family protein [Lewinellaceae bacterium]|nr:dihydrodipicolinate synthase family protein [Phaeodactylibacter sp.]MCB9039313.1 dihydrodipicolinate synthase family protein [Lewinellaceae bacterium]
MPEINITGVIPPMITPFTQSGEVDFAAHAANVQLWNEAGLRGYLVLGSNSEAVYLNEREKLELIERTRENARPEHLILAGAGMESTRETIHLIREAAKAGAHAALVITPFFYREQMKDDAQIRHFQAIADASPIPVLMYNVTKYTGVNLSPRAVGELSKHPNIIGMKDSSGSIPQLVQYQKAAAGDFNILVGTASAWYPALALGVRAAIMALANCAPAECVRVQELFDKGQKTEAEAFYRRLFPVNQAVTAAYGVAGLKYACTLRGYRGGFVRSPLPELSGQQKEEVKGILEEAGLMG